MVAGARRSAARHATNVTPPLNPMKPARIAYASCGEASPSTPAAVFVRAIANDCQNGDSDITVARADESTRSFTYAVLAGCTSPTAARVIANPV